MCGVVGFLSPVGMTPSTEARQAALAALRHRGPDGSGEDLIDCGMHQLWLGHRRLAIQDLSEAGAQPMTSRDGRWRISFNGEIYNHLELRRELPGPWRGHSDTETLVEALAAWGFERTLPRLNGIFALAAFDREQQSLQLARDPFGVKPIYFAETPAGLAFASEIRALAALTGPCFELDRDGLASFLSLRFVPSPSTLLAGLQRLPPGHFSRWHIGTGLPRETRCYVEPVAAPFQGSLAEASEAYRRLSKAAIRRQLLSDVPVGVLLSGGIDSALVAAMAVEAGQRPAAFTVGYEAGGAADEVDDAAETARLLQLPHHVVRLDAEGLWNALELAVGATEEPLVTPSALPMWALCQRARQQVTVVLTGQGSDELWGGYRRYQGELIRRLPGFQTAIGWAAPLLRRWPRVPDAVLRSAASAPIADTALRFESAYAVFSSSQRQRLLGMAQAPQALAAIRTWLRWAQAGRALTGAEQMMAIDTRLGLADDLLLYGDKISMAHSLEARVPLLDTELVALVESMPAHFRLALGRTKIVHKHMAERYLPRAIVDRPKKGFEVPIATLLRGAWRERVEGALFDQGALERLHLETAEVRQLWAEHQSGFRDHARPLFALLGLTVWRRQLASSIQ